MSNKSAECQAFINVWGLTEHGGHLDLRIIKQYLLTKPLKTEMLLNYGAREDS